MSERLESIVERSALDADALLALAATKPAVPVFYWEHPESRTAILGLGAAWQIRTAGPDRIGEASRAAAAALAALPRANDAALGPLVVGGFGFSDSGCPSRDWRELPATWFWIPEVAWIRRAGECRRVRVWRQGDLLGHERRLAEAEAASASASRTFPASPEAHVTADPDERRRWLARVEAARDRIAAGELAKVVLARRRSARLDRAADPGAILASARRARPSCFSFWIGAGETDFVASSPERLVELRGDRFVSGALAGSAPRGASAEEDERSAASLLASAKDRREHEFVVAAVREALAPVSRTLEVGEHPGVLRLPETHHLFTAVGGHLSGRRTVLELAALLHPTPAVCGVPREAARLRIEHEEPDRGWFTGAVGWMAADGSGVVAVALRSALLDGRRASLWAGAGIVRDSDAESEFLETEAKLDALFGSLAAGGDERAA